MLPGVRFVFAATVLAVSIVIFGLGAAAFLRAAHENLASATIWRSIDESAPPTLAMLRIAPEPMEAAPAAEPSTATIDVTSEAAVTSEDTPVATPLPAAAPDAPSHMQTDTAPPPVAAESEEPVTPVQVEAEPAENPTETMAAAEAVAPVTDPAPPTTVLTPPSDASVPVAAPEAMVASLVSEPTPETPVQEAANPGSAASTIAETPPAIEPPATPIAAQDGEERMSGTAAAPDTDTLKPEDRQIKTAMVTELPEVAPLPASEVRIPAPRIDPSVLEARRKRLLQQQARRARAAKARRIAAVRARAAAQTRAATTADPFGNPSTTISATQR